MADPGATRLGANVYTFNVGDKLERPSQITDEEKILEQVAKGSLASTLPVDGLDGETAIGSIYSVASSTQGSDSLPERKLPQALHNKYYKSRSGFGDTPKAITDSIKESLCKLDDTFSRNSPQTVHTGQYYRLKVQHDAEQRQLYRQAKLEATLAEEEEKDRKSRARMRGAQARRQAAEREREMLGKSVDGSRTLNDEGQPPASVSRDPEVLAMLADLRKDESARQKQVLKEKSAMKSIARGKIKGLAARKKRLQQQLKAKQAASLQEARLSKGQRRMRASPINRVDNAVRSMLSPESAGSDDFVLVTSRIDKGGHTRGTERRGTPKLVPQRSSRRSSGRLVTGRSPSVKSSARGASISSGRKLTEDVSVNGGKLTTKTIRSGAAAVLDLSSITEGLERGGSTYENEYGEDALKAIQEELKSTYKKGPACPLNNWLPKTEQTVINEAISLARKIQRQIDGLED